MHPSDKIRSTIVFGFLCALFFKPVQIMLGSLFSRPVPFRLSIWFYIFLYTLLLAKWGKKDIAGVIFPSALLMVLAFFSPSLNVFLLLSLVTLGWIRSGLCFPGSFMKNLGLELLICFGAAFPVSVFSPRSGLTWALAVWLFFLIQSVYFIFNTQASSGRSIRVKADSFEQARRQAEKILSGESV